MTHEFITVCWLILEERLTRVPSLKLIQQVETHWNSTYHMLQHVDDLREPVAAALAGLRTDIAPLITEQYDIIAESLKVLFSVQ